MKTELLSPTFKLFTKRLTAKSLAIVTLGASLVGVATPDAAPSPQEKVITGAILRALGTNVAIHCLTPEQMAVYSDTAAALTPVGVKRILIKESRCNQLMAIAQKPPQTKEAIHDPNDSLSLKNRKLDSLFALHVLGHELSHTRGNADERKAECEGIATSGRLGAGFGIPTSLEGFIVKRDLEENSAEGAWLKTNFPEYVLATDCAAHLEAIAQQALKQ